MLRFFLGWGRCGRGEDKKFPSTSGIAGGFGALGGEDGGGGRGWV